MIKPRENINSTGNLFPLSATYQDHIEKADRNLPAFLLF